MFDNEELGTDWVNWVEVGDFEITDEDTNSIGLSDPLRKYARVANSIGIHQITHVARMENMCNDFRHQFITINGIYNGSSAPTIADFTQYTIFDEFGAGILTVTLRGDGSFQVNDGVTVSLSAVGQFNVGEIFELKIEHSWLNDHLRPAYEIAVYLKGIEYRDDGAGNLAPYDGALYLNRFVNNRQNKPSYYAIRYEPIHNIIQVSTFNDWKNFCDIDARYGVVNLTIPFRELLILSNDVATFKYLGDNLTDFSITEQINNVGQADFYLAFDDMFAALQDRFRNLITADDSQNNFAFDNEIRLFFQLSRMMAEGVDGQTNNGPARLVDLNATFQSDGIQAGDWVYTWNGDLNHDGGRQITSVQSETEIRLDRDWNTVATVRRYYTIVRGMESYHDRHLGDYRFTGEFKRYDIGWDKNNAGVKLRCLDYTYFMTQWPIWCWARKYYYKDFDRIFRGWTAGTDTLLIGYGNLGDATDTIVGGLIYNYQQGLFSQSLFTPLYDTFLTELRGVYTHIFRPKTFLFDAMKRVLDKGFLQYVMFYDRENATHRYAWFRDLQDKSLNQTTFIKGGNQAATTIMEDIKIADSIKYSKGTEQFVDMVSVEGARQGDDTGQPLAAHWPIPSLPSRFTRQMFEVDDYIRIFNQSRQYAEAIYNNLARIDPEDGYITTSYFPQRDTWTIINSITWPDDGSLPYPGAPAAISHVTSQVRNTNGSSDGSLPSANKHSQGLEYRKPFSRIGETGNIDMDATFNEDFVIFEQVTESSGRGILTHIRPETKAFEIGEELSNVRRDIDRIGQNFVDPTIGECLLLPPDEVIQMQGYIGVSLIDLTTGGAPLGGAQLRLDFTPFTFVDEDNSDTAYSYLFYHRPFGSVAGTAWTQLPWITGGGSNEITDILNATSSIQFGPGGGAGSYQYIAPLNQVWLQFPAPGNYDILICLRQRFVTAAGNQFVPRLPAIVNSTTPGVRPTPEQDDEVIEQIVGGVAFFNGIHGLYSLVLGLP
jgi:hypothetical protein